TRGQDGSVRTRFSACVRRAPAPPDRRKFAADIFARKPRNSRIQSTCANAYVKQKIEFQPRMDTNTENQNLGDRSLSVGRWTLSVGRLLVMDLRKFPGFLLPLLLAIALGSFAREPIKSPPPTIQTKAGRARDLGIPSEGTPGRLNSITDVPGVEVGYTTLIAGEGKLEVGKGPVRTGVTAILPRGHASLNDPVYAGFFSLNGNGEMTGTAWVDESGFLEGPIVITNTHSVGVARDAVIAWRVKQGAADKTGYWWSLPVVAETWDGWLNDINGFHVKPADVWHALDSAHGGALEEGSVGGGTGMICYEFKGGN